MSAAKTGETNFIIDVILVVNLNGILLLRICVLFLILSNKNCHRFHSSVFDATTTSFNHIKITDFINELNQKSSFIRQPVTNTSGDKGKKNYYEKKPLTQWQWWIYKKKHHEDEMDPLRGAASNQINDIRIEWIP